MKNERLEPKNTTFSVVIYKSKLAASDWGSRDPRYQEALIEIKNGSLKQATSLEVLEQAALPGSSFLSAVVGN